MRGRRGRSDGSGLRPVRRGGRSTGAGLRRTSTRPSLPVVRLSAPTTTCPDVSHADAGRRRYWRRLATREKQRPAGRGRGSASGDGVLGGRQPDCEILRIPSTAPMTSLCPARTERSDRSFTAGQVRCNDSVRMERWRSTAGQLCRRRLLSGPGRNLYIAADPKRSSIALGVRAELAWGMAASGFADPPVRESSRNRVQ